VPRSEFHFSDPRTDLYISGVGYHIEDRQLFEAANAFGICTRVRICRDRVTERSRGFGFVRMASAEDAARALKGLDGMTFGSRTIRAKPVSPPPPRPVSEEDSEP
jgi:RNA recognition motif-containing protein